MSSKPAVAAKKPACPTKTVNSASVKKQLAKPFEADVEPGDVQQLIETVSFTQASPAAIIKPRPWEGIDISVDGIDRTVRRRPRVFKYFEYLKKMKPIQFKIDTEKFQNEFVDLELPDSWNDYCNRYEPWCFEFDIDMDGDDKTLRVECSWPSGGFLSIAEMEEYKKSCPKGYEEMFPEGIISFIDGMFPIAVDSKEGKIIFQTYGVPPDLDAKIKFVRYEKEPYGMLPEDCESAKSIKRKYTDPLKALWPKGPVKIGTVNESLYYFDKLYKVGSGELKWDVIRKLVTAKGERINLEGNPQSLFRRNDARLFWKDAIKNDKNHGSAGDGMHQIHNRKPNASSQN